MVEENISKSIEHMLIDMTDSINELGMLIEEVEVLAEDVLVNFFDNVNLKTERGRYIAQYDLNAAAVKGDIMYRQLMTAESEVRRLLEQSNNTLETVRELTRTP